MIDFGIDFWTILAPFWEPTWGHVGAQSRPGGLWEATRIGQELPQRPPAAQKPPKSRPASLQTSFWDHFGDDLGSFWTGFLDQSVFENI